MAVKAHAEMLLGASPQFVESPWAVAGLSSRDTANGTARGATIDHNVVPCFSSATSSDPKISDGKPRIRGFTG
jgi:hypothetical protein